MNYTLQKFLDLITSGYLSLQLVWEVRVISRDMSKVVDRKFFDSKEKVYEWFDRNFGYLQDKNVYFSLLPRIRKSGTKEDVKFGNTFVIDMDFNIDNKKELEKVANDVYKTLVAMMLRPTVVADSGHGLHVYYKLDGQIDIKEWIRINRLLFKLFKKLFKNVTVEMKEEATCIRCIGLPNNKRERVETRFLVEDYSTYRFEDINSMLNGLVWEFDFDKISSKNSFSSEELEEIYDFYCENANSVYSLFRIYDNLNRNQHKFPLDFVVKVNKMLREKFQEIGLENALEQFKKRYGRKIIGLRSALKGSIDPFMTFYVFYKRHKIRRSGSRKWIEELLSSSGIKDGRKRLIWLVFAPYLINVKGLQIDEAEKLILEWLERNSVSGKKISKSYVRGQLRHSQSIGLLPISREKAVEVFKDVEEILKKI